MPCRAVDSTGIEGEGKWHDAIADRGAYTVIPPPKNAKPWQTVTAGTVARNEALRTSKHLIRTLWQRWSDYRRRSRVETKPLVTFPFGDTLTVNGCERYLNCDSYSF